MCVRFILGAQAVAGGREESLFDSEWGHDIIKNVLRPRLIRLGRRFVLGAQIATDVYTSVYKQPHKRWLFVFFLE